ncbi:MAG TPA: glycosyltransferase family 2 protein [Gaiellaceae bacterium]
MIVVPAYHEAGAIGAVVVDLLKVAPVIVVDDASGDGTADAARAAGAFVVELDDNRGYGNAIDAGFREAVARGFRYVVTADGDGQHDPADVARAAEEVASGRYDLVVGIRPVVVRPVERLCALYAKKVFGIVDPLCGLKAYDVRFYEEYGSFDRRRSVGTELMTFALRHGARWDQWPISIRPRTNGDSRFYRSLRGNLRILRSLRALVAVR